MIQNKSCQIKREIVKTWSSSIIKMFRRFFKNDKQRCVKCVQIRSFFLSVFSRIRTEYGEILRISPYSVRMRENVEQNNAKYGHLQRSA